MTPAKLLLGALALNEVRGLLMVAASFPAWAPLVPNPALTIAITFAAVGMTLGLWSLRRRT